MEDLPLQFNFDNFILKNRYRLLIIFLGLIFLGGGFLFFRKSLNFSSTKVEVLGTSGTDKTNENITAEISGAVIKPGVYKLSLDARIDDLLIAAGGFSGSADRLWSDKYLNRAAKLADGQKVFIPEVESVDSAQDSHSRVLSAKNNGGYQTTSSNFSTDSNSLININTATISELDSLPGIGPVYAQKIIEHRPYSKTEDLVSSGAITQTIYEKIKNGITVY